MNWMCPVDQTAEIWSSPVAALSHIYHMGGRGHGPENSIQRGEDILWPQPTDEDPNRETVREDVEDYLSTVFSSEVSRLIREAEQEGFETPQMLSDKDLERFQILESSGPIMEDMDLLYERMAELDDTISYILKNFSQLEQSVEPEPEPEPDPEPEPEPDPSSSSGRFTTNDVMEREEREVFRLLERATFLDDHSDDLLETFKYVYQQRNDAPVTIDDVESELQVPAKMVESNLDQLEEMNVVIYDQNEDTFTVPY